MKGWQLIKPLKLEEKKSADNSENKGVKVKITKALVTPLDVLRYSGDIDVENVCLGSYGVGVVSEADVNLFELDKGKLVYIEPSRACGECYYCRKNEVSSCSDIKTAGEEFDGFLCDFVSETPQNLYPLPENINDIEALFIGYVSLAISVIDKLDIEKGDAVAIVGANNFGNILAQLLIYYQAVPIVVTDDEEDATVVKESGIYYVLGPNDNWQKEISSITGGRMAKNVVYIADSEIPSSKTFSLAAFNAKVAFTGIFKKNNPIAFSQAIKKQLNVYCINNGFGNTTTAINLIANNAVDLSHVKYDTAQYKSVPKLFATLNDSLDNDKKIKETVVDIMAE